MVAFKSLDEIALSMMDFLRLVQPDLDTKPGTIARDLMVDASASEISKLYGELRSIANLQSLASSTGTELDRLAKNYRVVRSVGATSKGIAVFTTNDLSTDIFIAAGTQVSSQSGLAFKTLIDVSLSSSNTSIYRANALRIQNDLDLAGITDQYALEVGVEAIAPGTGGNIGKYGIISHNVSGISSVTNTQGFIGGTSRESDTSFRIRALGAFAGANLGTELGYINALITDSRIQDALSVPPGDPLMIRDGTQTGTDSDGNAIVITSGTGGKVDLYIQGTDPEQNAESVIYKDQSGKNDATDSKNDIILGQRSINPNLDFQQKKRLLLELRTLPYQPVDTIVGLSGSLSGPNFVEKFIDSEGVTQGSFELIKDTGAFGGSSFGFDKIHFISNQISLTDESSLKGTFNGQDALDFTDIQSIKGIHQTVIITNENSTVNSANRSILTLHHTPVTSVTRVENLTTGERYSVSNQNFDGGTSNTTGRIQISGSTLPTINDTLQINYLWRLNFDDAYDFDNLQADTLFTRTVQDSIDWSFSNRVSEEAQTVLHSGNDGYHIIVEHNSSRVINVNTRTTETVTNVGGKLTVADKILNILTVEDSLGQELFSTFEKNGSFNNKEITLPTDTLSTIGSSATVTYNVADIYSPDGYNPGTFSSAIFKFDDGVVSLGSTVYADYIADIPLLLPIAVLSDLPATKSGNNFVVDSNIVGDQPVSSKVDGNGNIIRNLKVAPSYLRMNVLGISSAGRLTIQGTSFKRVDALLTTRVNGLTIDLKEAIESVVGLMKSTTYVSHVAKIEKVTLSNSLVSSVNFTFDLLNSTLDNINYANGNHLLDASLSTSQVKLSATQNNLDNQPVIGDTLRVSLFVLESAAVETITVSSAGVHVSKNKYVIVDKIAISSGFIGLGGSVDGSISINTLSQPLGGATYFTTYNYIAPKEGERLTLAYNFDRLISDSTFAIEEIRPITADVLVKSAKTIVVDISVDIIKDENFTDTNSTVEQSVEEAMVNLLTSSGLNAIIDTSDIILAASSVPGVDRVILTTFNKGGVTGLVKSISANRDSYFIAGTISATIEER